MEVMPLIVRPASSPSFSAINSIKVERIRKFEATKALYKFIMFGEA
jgi:hypothetical protein